MKKKTILFCIILAVVLLAGIAGGVVLLKKEPPKSYTVTFRDYDSTVLKEETVQNGNAASAPTDPQREGYTFAGWSHNYTDIRKDTVTTAEYVRITDTAFKVDTVTVATDAKTVDVKISVIHNPGILGMVFAVDYDESALKLVDCQNGDALAALAFMEPSKLRSGSKFVWYGSETGEITDGEMLILTFEIPESTLPGSYPITVSWNDADIYDGNLDMLKPSAIPGAIVIAEEKQ